MTKILPCRCSCAFQDQSYGAGKRVHNLKQGGGSGNEQWRCTVCGEVKTAASKGGDKQNG